MGRAYGYSLRLRDPIGEKSKKKKIQGLISITNMNMLTSGQVVELPLTRKAEVPFDTRKLLRIIKAQVRTMLDRWRLKTLDGLNEDDLTQEIAIFMAKDQGAILARHDPALGPYERFVRMVTICRMRDFYRRHRRRLALFPRPQVLSDDYEPPASTPDPSRTVEARSQLACVRRCIERAFGPEYLQTFLLKARDDLSYKEIAKLLGVTTYVVNNRIYEIRNHLEQCAKECGCKNIRRKRSP